MINLIAVAAILAYLAGGAYTMHRMRRVEKYFQRECNDDEQMPFLLWLAGVVAWPTMLPAVIYSTRKDPIP